MFYIITKKYIYIPETIFMLNDALEFAAECQQGYLE